MKVYIIIYNDRIFERKTTILFKLLYVPNTNNKIATESQFLAYNKFFKLEIFHFVYSFVIQNIIMTAKTNIFIIKKWKFNVHNYLFFNFRKNIFVTIFVTAKKYMYEHIYGKVIKIWQVLVR